MVEFKQKLILKKKIINYSIFLFFIFYFLVGINIYQDYGISIDEPFHRSSGFYWYLWIIERFSFNFENLEYLKNSFGKMEFSEDFLNGTYLEYGVIFDLLAVFIEDKFNIKNSQDVFYIKHFLNFFIFYISSVAFFYLIKKRFKDNLLALIGVIFYITSPRIFAESFYNCKDIVFMSLSVLSVYFGFLILKNQKIKNIILFTFFSALATGVRSMGIFTVILVLGFFVFDIIEKKIFSLKQLNIILAILIFYAFFTYLIWPYLWEEPINHFITAFNSFKNYSWGGSVLYLGDYIKGNNLPWHYSFVWIGISTPVIYLLLFIIGSYKVFYNFLTNLDGLWKNLDEKLDLFILAFFCGPLIAVIIFNSTLYNGWRQLYFIYPALIYLSIFGLNYFLNFNWGKLFKFSIFIIIFSSIFINVFILIKLHPFQNIYFNLLAEKKANNLFEIDYWGLGNAHSISKILNELNETESISIKTASFTPLKYSRYIINNKKINNIDFTGTSKINSEYIFTNYTYEADPKFKKKYLIPENYKKVYTLKRGKIVINEIFKKK